MAHTKDPGWQYLKISEEKRLADSTKKFDSKKNVWIADKEECYVAAEIKSTKGDTVVVVSEAGVESTVKKDAVQQMNPPKYEKTEDMANLTFLNDASVLHNLKARYSNMMIYTYSGLFCVVINPYKRLPIYTDSVAQMYMGKRRNEMPPHLFASSDEAYRNMMEDHENQSMLITGESGAGKTENTKKVIAYFATVGASQGTKTDGPSLEDQIVRTNPVLEAFGNAKTVRNNNSSRFGKFIRIHFNKAGKLAGCDIEHYLLEKSRVVKQARGERSYHIFYQMMSEGVKGLKAKIGLTQPLKEYTFVAQAELTIDGVDDKEEMDITNESFDIMSFTAQEKLDLFRMCAGIMQVGRAKFKQRPREENAEIEDAAGAMAACEQWGCNGEDFVRALVKPRVKVGAEWVNKGQNVDQVNWAIAGLAKGIYARQFHWLINRCNKTLSTSALPRDQFIGVLDIAGFEIFDHNSFEQLWINFVNEKLQQFFNHHMFVLEQEEYKREGIQWTFIDFGLDLQQCIELIEKPMGVISMLDEECVVPKGTDKTFASKLCDMYMGKHPNLQKAKPAKGKQAQADFAIVHYAGVVRYNVTGFLEKNKDPLNDTAVNVLKGAKENALMQDLWADYKTQEEQAQDEKKGKVVAPGKRKGKSSSFLTVSMMYRTSLNTLMAMLHETHPHFIRCIIPNEIKKSGYIESGLVMNQLTCNGVLEGIRICRKGFPNRLLFPEFKQRYAVLAADAAKSGKDVAASSTAMLKVIVKRGDLKDEEVQAGTTKVFFKAGVLAHLEELRDVQVSRIVAKFQNLCRWYAASAETKRRQKQISGYTILQKNIRGWCVLRTWPWFKLYSDVKPLISKFKENDEEKLRKEKAAKEEAERLAKEAARAKELEVEAETMRKEKETLLKQLEEQREAAADGDQRAAALASQKMTLEREINDLTDGMSEAENRIDQMGRQRRQMEADNDTLKANVQDLETSVKKQEADRQAREHQMRALQDEMTQTSESLARTARDKKVVEEANRKLQEDLHAEEDKLHNATKARQKLEHALDETEANLERERRAKADLEKAKRKLENELHTANEALEEAQRMRADMEQTIKKRDADMMQLSSRLEDESANRERMNRQLKDLQHRIAELEDELEAERALRSKAEKARQDLHNELEQLADRLDEAGGATQAQIELNKKREAELAKLRRELEEAVMQHEGQMEQMRKKHNDAVVGMNEQLDQLQKSKSKVEKDKHALSRDRDTVQQQLEQEGKARAHAERSSKQADVALSELQMKSDEQTRHVGELSSVRTRLQQDNTDLARQLEECESQVAQLSRNKQQLTAHVEEARQNADHNDRDRANAVHQLNSVEADNLTLRGQLEDETDSKTDLQRQLHKANGEAAQWRSKFENEGGVRFEEAEETRRRLQARLIEMQEQFESATTRMSTVEKNRQRMQGELEDSQLNAERAHAQVYQLEKKHKQFDGVLNEWKMKVDALNGELDMTTRDARQAQADVLRLRASGAEADEVAEGLRREKKAIEQDLKDLNDQLSDGGRSVHELNKIRRRLELEKDELVQALEDAESTLEAEEAKTNRLNVELAGTRGEIDRRIAEKEEEFDNTRKNHVRQLESMQASLEAEQRGRNDTARLRKKLEHDLASVEAQVDNANRSQADAIKAQRRAQEQHKEVQNMLDELRRERDEARERAANAERRCNATMAHKTELETQAHTAERQRRTAESDLSTVRDEHNQLMSRSTTVANEKRRLEQETLTLRGGLEDALDELKTKEETYRRSVSEAGKATEDAKREQERANQAIVNKKDMEHKMRDMSARLSTAEGELLRGGKKHVTQLEHRIAELEGELEAENKRSQEFSRVAKNRDRRVRELQFEVEEDKKVNTRTSDTNRMLTDKVKVYQGQISDVETLATENLHKYKQMQLAYADAESRADQAEQELTRTRARNRLQSSSSASNLAHSFSSSNVMRKSRSRGRFNLSSAANAAEV